MPSRKARSEAPPMARQALRSLAIGERSIGWRFDLMDDGQWPFPLPSDDDYLKFLDSLERIVGMPHEMWDNPAHIEPYENLSEAGQARLADIGLKEAAMRHGLAKFK